MKKYLLLLGLSTLAFNAYAGCEKGEANCWDCSKANDATSSCTARLKDGTLTVSGTGSMKGYSWDAPWRKSGANKLVVENGITQIGYSAFYGMSNLTEVTLPEGLTSISGYAFRGDSSLHSIEIPSTVTLTSNSLSNINNDLEIILTPKENTQFVNAFGDCCGTSNYAKSKIVFSCKGNKETCQQMMQKSINYLDGTMHASVAIDYYKVKDKDGNVIEEWGPNGKNTYKYDNGGNVVAQFGPNGERLYGKKIYTIEEAEKATAKGDKFHVSLTYK